MVCFAQTVHLSCAEINTLETDRNELPLDPCHLGVPSSASKMIMRLPYVRCTPSTYLVSRFALYANGQYELVFDPRHLAVSSSVS
jgi:hypothetical protein